MWVSIGHPSSGVMAALYRCGPIPGIVQPSCIAAQFCFAHELRSACIPALTVQDAAKVRRTFCRSSSRQAWRRGSSVARESGNGIGGIAVDQILEPGSIGSMVGGILSMRVYQDVDVFQ